MLYFIRIDKLFKLFLIIVESKRVSVLRFVWFIEKRLIK